jgi:GNAT superfamily N-acetyltransferase
MSIQIVPLTERPELVGMVAGWCHEAFASAGTGIEAVEEAVRDHLTRDRFPFTLVALIDGRPCGCVHGVESELDDRPELEPFVAALYVVPAQRRGGVGTALLAAAEAHCAVAGFSRAYLCAWSRPEWYERRGWRVLVQSVGEKCVPLMTRNLAATD